MVFDESMRFSVFLYNGMLRLLEFTLVFHKPYVASLPNADIVSPHCLRLCILKVNIVSLDSVGYKPTMKVE